jgi:hypothetical protein
LWSTAGRKPQSHTKKRIRGDQFTLSIDMSTVVDNSRAPDRIGRENSEMIDRSLAENRDTGGWRVARSQPSARGYG